MLSVLITFPVPGVMICNTTDCSSVPSARQTPPHQSGDQEQYWNGRGRNQIPELTSGKEDFCFSGK